MMYKLILATVVYAIKSVDWAQPVSGEPLRTPLSSRRAGVLGKLPSDGLGTVRCSECLKFHWIKMDSLLMEV